MKYMIRRIVLFLGYLNVLACGLIMTHTVIMQWYAPGNTWTFYFNNYGEAFFEHIMGILMVPCTLYYLYHSLARLRAQ